MQRLTDLAVMNMFHGEPYRLSCDEHVPRHQNAHPVDEENEEYDPVPANMGRVHLTLYWQKQR